MTEPRKVTDPNDLAEDDTYTPDYQAGADSNATSSAAQSAPAASSSTAPKKTKTRKSPTFTPVAWGAKLSTNASDWSPLTRNEIIDKVTAEVIAQTPVDASPSSIERQLIEHTNAAFTIRNEALGSVIKHRGRYAPILAITPSQTAALLLVRHSVVSIRPSGKNTDPDFDMLAIYQTDGPDKGIYASSLKVIRSTMRSYNSALTKKDAEEIVAILEESAPRRERSLDRDLIPVNNGIFNYKTKVLTPFSPDVVTTAKARVDLLVDANGVPIEPKNPSFTMHDGEEWDVESWLRTLTDDPEIEYLLWQIMGAIVRPFVRWSKAAWFYSESGNNGKGTLVELMRCLVGEASYVSLPISEMGKDFALEGLTRASAILTDENDVGVFVDRAANLKAIITNDVIAINRKFRTPVTHQHWGFMVQCFNEMPQTKDKSESIYRRQLFVPFTKSFTGVERSYIKDEYIQNNEVLQYVLWKVLVDLEDYYRLNEPAAVTQLLDEYKIFNDPVRAYWAEFETRFVWDFLPDSFLYDHFKEWFAIVNPNGHVMSMQNFRKNLWVAAEKSLIFDPGDPRQQQRPGNRMDNIETLIFEFKLERWSNPGYKGSTPEKYSAYTVSPSARMRGLSRRDTLPAHLALLAGINPEVFEDTPSSSTDN